MEAGAVVAVTDIVPQPDQEFIYLQAEMPGRLHYYPCDVTSREQLVHAFDQIFHNHQGVDGIITAAGICIDKPFLEHTWEDIQRQQAVNETGTFFAIQQTVRKMKEQGTKGSIVMICSQTAQHVSPGHQLTAYAGSKGFVWSFARNLAHELASDGIRVNTISPGYIATAMNLSIAARRPDLHRIFNEAPPMGRMGRPEDLKMAALYLLGEGSAYVSGLDLVVDGGMSVTSGTFKSIL
ncbi:SDR family NAD(P)-dependent oxidoreductase [Aspergillus fischeri NRRL 181]|uniref:Short-chain dehydrogenase n=1 Tax=Neosartorya fischeri (strain ATCC 1020 / DSM 3700 / CBS 544.65 / FGSC A1164 / JCM 1740 / NRRL 181 / WB 181) TaxID=331117 RepID=A1DJY9_NEOFI|nr:short-chain dehydrogenase [Aspergillus fischeri NRRL 181]EAW17028.1 short-chain dehydrogenase [Aspergillus fischeri NRRL 181]